MNATPIITVRGLHKSFGHTEVLRGIDLDIRDGAVTRLIGPSGSGKSTLLRCLNHLEVPDSGEIRFRGELIGYHEKNGCLHEASGASIARLRSRMGMVFQGFNLFGHMTALQNVACGPVHVRGMKRREAQSRARTLLQQVGLADRADNYPSQLSGGQQQRVAIARALAMEPQLLLMDEPTSALDPDLVGEVLQAIVALARSGTTMVVVTHEMGLVRDIADQVFTMADGRIARRGSAADILPPATDPQGK